MSEVTKRELDGLGGRVTTCEVAMGAIETKTERNEEDIQKIFDNLAKLPFWIVGTMLIPSLLILYQILSKQPG
jgi:hypothetical protein